MVNASSEQGRVAVNGMSNHDRAGENANSALIVTVTPKDFPDQTALGGVRFQQRLEEAAFRCGAGKIPVQLYGDFRAGRVSGAFGDVKPAILGGFSFGNLRETLPEEISGALIEAVDYFGSVIQGFDREDAILAGVESRTSSPLRILRDRGMESKINGLAMRAESCPPPWTGCGRRRRLFPGIIRPMCSGAAPRFCGYKFVLRNRSEGLNGSCFAEGRRT